jgi:hypothetical protein
LVVKLQFPTLSKSLSSYNAASTLEARLEERTKACLGDERLRKLNKVATGQRERENEDAESFSIA